MTFAILGLFTTNAFANVETNGHASIDLQISNAKHDDLKGKTGVGTNAKMNLNPDEKGFTTDIVVKLNAGKNSYQQAGVNLGWRLGERYSINPYAGFGTKIGKYNINDNDLKQRRIYSEIGITSELHFAKDKFFIQPSIAYQHDLYNKSKFNGLEDKEKGRSINTELAFNFKVTENNKGDNVYLRIAPYHDYYTNKTNILGGDKHKYRESGVRVGVKF